MGCSEASISEEKPLNYDNDDKCSSLTYFNFLYYLSLHVIRLQYELLANGVYPWRW